MICSMFFFRNFSISVNGRRRCHKRVLRWGNKNCQSCVGKLNEFEWNVKLFSELSLFVCRNCSIAVFIWIFGEDSRNWLIWGATFLKFLSARKNQEKREMSVISLAKKRMNCVFTNIRWQKGHCRWKNVLLLRKKYIK